MQIPAEEGVFVRMASLSLLLLLHLLLLVSGASASSKDTYVMFGGSLTFSPKGWSSDGTYDVEIHNTQTAVNCYVNNYWCYSGRCGTRTKSTNSIASRNSFSLRWCQSSVVHRFKLSEGNLPFEIRYPAQYFSTTGKGFWISNIKSSRAYSKMMINVDLGTRSDTGESNRSPITTILPVLRIPRNCPRSFNLTVFDPDGDRVRCRMPKKGSSHECGMCGPTEAFSLDEDSCSLQYRNGRKQGYHPIELIIEDFPTRPVTLTYTDNSYTVKRPFSADRHKRHEPSTTTTAAPTTASYRKTIAPLSKIPLQFTIEVGTHQITSCADGDFFPVFVAPTPRNGVNLPAFVNQTLEIKVRSKAQYTKMYALIVTGPKGTSKHRITAGDYIIKWTPTDDEVNDHFPICFIFEAFDKSYRVYQSELRCVTVDVGRHDTIVTCNQTAIRVEVEKSYLIRRNEDSLHLNDFSDANCNLSTRSNRTHLVALMSLNTCGTILEEDDNNIIFKNKITSADPSKIISRQHDVDIAFSCVYPKLTNLTLGFKHKNPYAFSEKGFGAFTFQFEFFESQRFRTQVDASTYPVEVYLKQMMFMQIEATTSIPNTVLFVESCKATPYDNANSRVSYTIIEHGCARDSTVQIYPSSRTQFRFGMEAFEFIGAHNNVYITCAVMLCENGVSGTRCSQGCVQSDSGHHHRKRAAVAETSRHSISQGPLHLVRPSDSPATGPGLNLFLNLLFVVGVLLACGVMIHRSKTSKVQYQQLETSEAD